MTQQRIINESLNLFASTGYENTSLAMIAERVGIKKPSLYNHFENKEAIFTAVLNEVARREVDFLREEAASIESPEIQDHLYSIYKVYLEHMASSTEGVFFKRVTFFPPELFATDIKRVFLDVEESLTSIIIPIFNKGKRDQVLRDLPTDMMTSAFYTLIDGLFLEEHFYTKEIFEQRKKASWEIFWLGIKKQG